MDISNGEGIGVSLFVQGCPFHCYNCFNSNTWDYDGGQEWTVEVHSQFLRMLNNPHITRVSLLGGEPLDDKNIKEVLKLVDNIRLYYPNKTIWLYSGYTWEEIFHNNGAYTLKDHHGLLRQKIVKQCDVLIDGRYIDSKRDITLHWCGSSNQRVIDVQTTLEKGEIVLWQT